MVLQHTDLVPSRPLVSRVLWSGCSVGLLLLVGCGPSTPTREPMPIPTAPTPTAPAEESSSGEIDFPKLPSGAGPIDEDAPKEFTTTKTGLQYRILRQGTGKKPTVLNSVEAHYRGWLKDGTEFDSSYKRGKPTSFPLNSVVEGWREGIPYCAEGGMIELIIPSKLGYGPRGQGPIPPNSTLHFLVEVKSVR